MKLLSFYLIAIYLVVETLAVANIDDNHGLNLPNLQDLNINGLDLPTNLTSKVPSTEEIEKTFREKCEKYGGPGAYEESKKAVAKAQECVQGLVNVTELKEEMEKAKPTGDLDIVFRKYCRKAPMLKDCIMNVVDVAEECFDDAEKENKKIITNVTDSLIGFICFKEGDRIALFIAEGGPECLTEKEQEIKNCVNKTVSKYIPAETPTLENIPLLLLQPEQCDDYQALQECVVTELEKCSEPTPANIVDSMFNFVRKVTPCAGHKKAVSKETVSTHTGGATTLFSSLLLTGLSVAVIKFLL